MVAGEVVASQDQNLQLLRRNDFSVEKRLSCLFIGVSPRLLLFRLHQKNNLNSLLQKHDFHTFQEKRDLQLLPLDLN